MTEQRNRGSGPIRSRLKDSLILGALLPLVTACNPGFLIDEEFSTSLSSFCAPLKPHGHEQLVSQGKVSLLGEGLKFQPEQEESLVSLKSASQVAEGDFTSLMIPEGTSLVGTVDLNCLEGGLEKQGPNMILSLKLAETSERIPGIQQQAFTLTTAQDIPYLELVTQANEDLCLISLSSDVEAFLQMTPNDPRFAEQTDMRNIELVRGRELGFNDQEITSEVILAVIDTGVDYNHPDLREQMWSGRGRSFVGDNTDPMDNHFHGTHVAGLAAAASNNGVGISGVGTRQVKIMALKVFEGASGSLAPIVNAVNFATDQGAHVINMSLGTGAPSPALRDALIRATDNGVVVFVAAGNDGQSLAQRPTYPALYSDIPGVITVGSINAQNSEISGFSNFSPTAVQILAPGSNGAQGVLSTVPTSFNATGYASRINNNPIQGTSMAAPIAAGAGALVVGYLRSKGHIVTPALVESMIKDAAIKDAQLSSRAQDGNRLSLARLAEFVTQNANAGLRIVQQPRDQILPLNGNIRLEVLMSEPNAQLNYQWFKNGERLAEATSATLEVVGFDSEDAGEYWVEVRSSNSRWLPGNKFRLELTPDGFGC